MRKIYVKVTERDILNGKRFTANYCPVARAIKRVVKKGGSFVNAQPGMIYIGRKNVPAPQIVSFFIREFDKTGYADPFEFDLEY